MTLGTTIYVVVYKLDADSPQEEKECITKEAADDYKKTVQLLGGIAIVQPKFIPQGGIK